ncbi:MAG: cellobiose phosphorylase [Butyrivibrio sp.]|nr:cellobiose phosphorylase [Acetatifactor muris]MCM1558395.1 cellobiose phosphorylase [Butyrivibrio sp.]
MEGKMKGYSYTDQYGSFHMENPEQSSYLYFPLAGESGLKASVTPLLGGDSKIDQNTFLLEPVSVENLHTSKSTRNFWCILEEQKVWSATGASAETEGLKGTPEEEKSALDAGVMWHRVTRKSGRYSLTSEITSFVPCDRRTFEVMSVKIKNPGETPVSFIPVAAIPLYARSADNVRDHRHVTSLLHRIKVNQWGVEVTPTLTFDERGHKKNDLSYFVYGADGEGRGPERCCPRTEDFIGEGGSLARPGSLWEFDSDGWVKAPREAETAVYETAGGEAMGALAFRRRTLGPGEEACFCICMGITPIEERETLGESLMKEYGTSAGVEAALEKVQRQWREKINVRFETGKRDLDGYLYWVAFQPILRRMYGCSFLPYHDYGKGGRGWRDLWQDCLALLIMEPDGVRRMLLESYGGVRMDGTNATIIGQGPGEFLADRNNIVRVWMDHGVWPFITTLFYIMQTGDLAVLHQQVSYFKDSQICRGEDRDTQWEPEQGTLQRSPAGVVTGTVLEHILLQNITAFYDVGEHNHIRLRGADWNDAYDMAGENGESVAFTAAYAGNLEQLAELTERYAATVSESMEFQQEILCLLQARPEMYDSVAEKQRFAKEYYNSCRHELTGKKQRVSLAQAAETLRGMADWIKEHIRKTEWVETPEGGFYNGYYDNHKNRLEGSFPGGTRMTLTSQVFPIMSGTATEEQTEKIVKAADRLLYEPKLGGYKLNTDFGELKDDMGRAFGFAYGHKENGAVFSHMAVMYANALLRRGFVREGYQALDALYRQASDFERSRIYPGLPEYFDDRGRGMYPYLTGSASWLLMTMVTEVCGVKGFYGDLSLEPKLVRELLDEHRRLEVRLQFAGVPLHICFRAQQEQDVYTRVKSLTLDGALIQGNRIPREALRGGDGEKEILVQV